MALQNLKLNYSEFNKESKTFQKNIILITFGIAICIAVLAIWIAFAGSNYVTNAKDKISYTENGTAVLNEVNMNTADDTIIQDHSIMWSQEQSSGISSVNLKENSGEINQISGCWITEGNEVTVSPSSSIDATNGWSLFIDYNDNNGQINFVQLNKNDPSPISFAMPKTSISLRAEAYKTIIFESNDAQHPEGSVINAYGSNGDNKTGSSIEISVPVTSTLSYYGKINETNNLISVNSEEISYNVFCSAAEEGDFTCNRWTWPYQNATISVENVDSIQSELINNKNTITWNDVHIINVYNADTFEYIQSGDEVLANSNLKVITSYDWNFYAKYGNETDGWIYNTECFPDEEANTYNMTISMPNYKTELIPYCNITFSFKNVSSIQSSNKVDWVFPVYESDGFSGTVSTDETLVLPTQVFDGFNSLVLQEGNDTYYVDNDYLFGSFKIAIADNTLARPVWKNETVLLDNKVELEYVVEEFVPKFNICNDRLDESLNKYVDGVFDKTLNYEDSDEFEITSETYVYYIESDDHGILSVKDNHSGTTIQYKSQYPHVEDWDYPFLYSNTWDYVTNTEAISINNNLSILFAGGGGAFLYNTENLNSGIHDNNIESINSKKGVLDLISTKINFVAEESPDNPQEYINSWAAQTGDNTCIMLIVLSLLVIFILIAGKMGVNRLAEKQSHMFNILVSRLKQIYVIVSALIIAFLFLVSIMMFGSLNAYAQNEEGITATVNKQTGQITIPNMNLTNTYGVEASIDMSKVIILDEILDIKDIEKTKFEILGLGGCVYSGFPIKDAEYTPKDISTLLPDQNAELAFTINGVDKDTAIALIGHTGFEVNLQITSIDRELTWSAAGVSNIGSVKVEGQSVESGVKVKPGSNVYVAPADQAQATNGYTLYVAWQSPEGETIIDSYISSDENPVSFDMPDGPANIYIRYNVMLTLKPVDNVYSNYGKITHILDGQIISSDRIITQYVPKGSTLTWYGNSENNKDMLSVSCDNQIHNFFSGVNDSSTSKSLGWIWQGGESSITLDGPTTIEYIIDDTNSILSWTDVYIEHVYYYDFDGNEVTVASGDRVPKDTLLYVIYNGDPGVNPCLFYGSDDNYKIPSGYEDDKANAIYYIDEDGVPHYEPAQFHMEDFNINIEFRTSINIKMQNITPEIACNQLYYYSYYDEFDNYNEHTQEVNAEGVDICLSVGRNSEGGYGPLQVYQNGNRLSDINMIWDNCDRYFEVYNFNTNLYTVEWLIPDNYRFEKDTTIEYRIVPKITYYPIVTWDENTDITHIAKVLANGEEISPDTAVEPGTTLRIYPDVNSACALQYGKTSYVKTDMKAAGYSEEESQYYVELSMPNYNLSLYNIYYEISVSFGYSQAASRAIFYKCEYQDGKYVKVGEPKYPPVFKTHNPLDEWKIVDDNDGGHYNILILAEDTDREEIWGVYSEEGIENIAWYYETIPTYDEPSGILVFQNEKFGGLGQGPWPLV